MNLRQMRLESGLKAAKIPKELNISREHLYHLEKGKYQKKKKHRST